MGTRLGFGPRGLESNRKATKTLLDANASVWKEKGKQLTKPRQIKIKIFSQQGFARRSVKTKGQVVAAGARTGARSPSPAPNRAALTRGERSEGSD